MTKYYRLDGNKLCSDVPTEVQALSSNLSNWGITTGNSFGTVCGWIEDARFPGAGNTHTTRIDYQQMGYTGTIPSQAIFFHCTQIRVYELKHLRNHPQKLYANMRRQYQTRIFPPGSCFVYPTSSLALTPLSSSGCFQT